MADDRRLLGILGPVAGAVAAASAGANPLLGLLAGHRFSKGQDERDVARRQSREAIDRLQGILAERRTVQAPSTRTALLGLDEVTPLNIPGRRLSVPAVQTDTGRQEAVGLLADVSLPAFERGLLGEIAPRQQQQDPNVIRTLQAAGIDPRGPDGQQLIRQNIGGGDLNAQLARMQAAMAEIDLQRRAEELARMRSERVGREQSAAQKRVEFGDAVKLDIQRGFELANLLDGLEDTVAQPGAASDVRQFGVGLAGLVNPASRDLAARAERFDQLSTGFGLRSLELLKGVTITDAKFGVLLKNSLSSSKSPGANRLALADILDENLRGADKFGVEVQNRQRVEELIRDLRQGHSSEPANAKKRFVFDPRTGQLQPK